jgi:hypothetical protein
MKQLTNRLSLAIVTLLILVFLPSSAIGAAYYVNPKGLWVPGQNGIGYYDLGQSVVVGKINPFKVVVMGGSLTKTNPNYRFKMLKVEGASAKEVKIHPKTGLIYGAGPSIKPGDFKVYAQVNDAKGYYYKFWLPISISQCNSAGSILDGTLIPCPQIAFDNVNLNRVAYFQPGKKGVEYNLSLFATAGLPPYQFAIADQTELPKGLTLNAKLGLIKGVPTQSGNFTFRWRTIDSVGNFTTSEATLTIKR